MKFPIAQNTLKTIGVPTCFLAIPIFMLLIFLKFIVLKEHADWELFSFNAYTGVLLFLVSGGIVLIISSLMKNKINKYLLLFTLLFLPDILSLIFTGNSIFSTLFSNGIKGDNYSLIAYPLATIVSYFIILKLKN